MKQFLILLLAFFPVIVQAQNKEGQELADSLLRVLPSMAEDTGKVKALNRISFAYNYVNPDTSLIFAEQALALAKKLNWQSGIAKADVALGNSWLTKFSNAKALNYFLASLAINEKTGSKMSIAQNLGNISNVYSNESNYPLALEYNFKALKIFEELGDKRDMAINLANLGALYRNQSNYPKALEYNFKALNLSQEMGMKTSVSSAFNNIGNIYMDKGIYDTALIYDLKGLKIAQDMGDKIRIAVKMISIGNVYLHLGQFEKALEYNMGALKIGEETNDKMVLVSSLGNMGDYYLYLAKDTIHTGNSFTLNRAANLKQAAYYLQKALPLIREIEDLDELQLVNQSLSEAQFLLGNYKDALQTYKDYTTAKDSIFSVENNLKIADLETTRNLDLKEKDIQIEQLKAKNKRNERALYITGIIVLLAIMGVVVWKFISQVTSNKELSQEKRRHLEHIQAQGDVLKDIAHVQSHELRGPVSTLIGLAKLFNQQDPHDPYNAELMQDVITVTERLDKIVKDVVTKENEVIIDTSDSRNV